MAGGLLNHDVALVEMHHLAVVHLEPDLSFEDDRVVERRRLVHLRPGLLERVGEIGKARREFLPDRCRVGGSFGDAGTGPDVLRQQSLDALAAANRFAAASRYIAGDAFSLADISAFTIAQASADRIDWALVPQLKRWFEEVGQREAIKRGLAAFDAPA